MTVFLELTSQSFISTYDADGLVQCHYECVSKILFAKLTGSGTQDSWQLLKRIAPPSIGLTTSAPV